MVPLALFDLDNTLVDRDRAFRRWTVVFCEQFRLGEDAAPWLVEADGDGVVARSAFMASARDRFSLTMSVDDLVEWYASTYPRCYVPEDGSRAALERLRAAGWGIGVVTNGRWEQQTEKVRRTGMDQVVDAVCVSEDLGVRKPDPRIFREAARRCGRPLRGWMVGDSPEADVLGGAGVGLRTVWLDRGRSWPTPWEPPSRSVSTVEQAVRVLLEEEQGTSGRGGGPGTSGPA